jgi:catechol 2,3-dioxygenase-like lactoylglutathione lyase family enzyme
VDKARAEDRGIPTATNVDHVGITVPDLDEAIAFFTEVLGCELLWRIDGIEDPEGAWMSTRLNVHPDASMDVAMLRCGPTTNVELFQYEAPDQKKDIPKNSDHGASHLAFYVTDIRAAVTYLERHPGVKVLGKPETEQQGPTKGHEWVYFLTPWGMQMEVICWPKGMPYEQETNGRLYGPEPSWTTRR